MKTTKFLAGFCLLLVTTTVGGLAQNATGKSAKNTQRVVANQPTRTPEGSGVVRYDPGAPADRFSVGDFYGNRFNTRSGSPLEFPGTLTRISWYQGAATRAWFFLGPFSPGPFVNSARAVAAPFAFNSVAVNWRVQGAFFVGAFNNDPSYGSVGIRYATTNMQGNHGAIRVTGGTYVDYLNGNVMIRVSGNVVTIPVELLEFEIE